MIFHIPPEQTRRWNGIYPGEYIGTLWKTHNVDFDYIEGKVTLARRMAKSVDTTLANDSNLGTMMTFLRTDADAVDRWWGLTYVGDTGIGGRLFKTANAASPDTGWVEDTLAGSPTDARDMAIHENDSDGFNGADTTDTGGQNQLFVTRDTDISVLNDTAANTWVANWWVTTKAQKGLTPGVPHPIDVFTRSRLAVVGDANLVHSIDKSEVISYGRLVLPHYFQVEHIFHTKDRIWILTSHKFTGNGAIFEWDGTSTSYNNQHDGYAARMLTGVNYREVPIVINNKGQILEWNGNGFSPMERGGQKIQFPIVDEPGNSFQNTPPFAIAPRGMTIGEDGLIYINVKEGVNSSYKHNAGIWCLNPITGRFYNKYAIGQWGVALDFGQQVIQRPGAIYPIPSALSDRGFLVGGRVYDVFPGTVLSGIWTLEAPTSLTATRGYLITNFIPSSEIRNFWDQLWVKHKIFITATDNIIVKARGTRSLQLANGFPLEGTITWTGASTFTVTLAAADDALAVGDEVEVLAGDNAGVLAHITVIAGAHAALQTITIDEATTVSATAARAYFNRWKKLGVISNTTNFQDVVDVGIAGDFIQYRLEFRGPWKELEVSELIGKFNADQVVE